jgi:hypothetical protein
MDEESKRAKNGPANGPANDHLLNWTKLIIVPYSVSSFLGSPMDGGDWRFSVTPRRKRAPHCFSWPTSKNSSAERRFENNLYPQSSINTRKWWSRTPPINQPDYSIIGGIEMKHKLTLWVSMIALLAILLLGGFTRVQAGRAEASALSQGCNLETLQGAYGSRQDGTLNGLPFDQVNRISSDGAGNITGAGTVVLNGNVIPVTFAATYTVDPDCRGVFSSSTGIVQHFVIKEDGSEVKFIMIAHPAGPANISGEAMRLRK